MPKTGKRDMTSARSWRPIALLSCIGKGLERIIAKRIDWTALKHGIISPQHSRALPKRSTMDLVASFTHNMETALAAGKKVTIITIDIQEAFDTLLKRRLLVKITEQGWPKNLLLLVDSFLTKRKVRVRLEQATTKEHPVACGTPQGSPLSPVLYILYLAELILENTSLRFGYTDDICLYKASKTLEENTRLLARDIQDIIKHKTAQRPKLGQTESSTHLDWHMTQIEKVLTIATRGVIPAWKTTPVTTLYREAGLPSAMATLKEAKLRFALRLQSVDETHPLTKRIEPPMIIKRRGTGSRQRAKTKIQ
ncbi:hypothetical protein SBOR_6311 [Sclerotinia borealis F-4128]|uniref:Reverse transcriptase domain-containing protein n=1 Tax=Sclerotinia borealis (strain F-4128) TaxID=1432307 RepID=W9CFM4_SCLBF|nr:hypothetical protein SBOR_6311 [Sclerotinia borealis F-4128]